MTCYEKIHCPACGGTQIVKAGKSAQGSQRYRCQSSSCTTKTFLRDYRYQAYVPGVKKQLVEMAINGSGIRDTARVLKISKGTVISTLKKSRNIGSASP